jgi:hypothetical protein
MKCHKWKERERAFQKDTEHDRKQEREKERERERKRERESKKGQKSEMELVLTIFSMRRFRGAGGRRYMVS